MKKVNGVKKKGNHRVAAHAAWIDMYCKRLVNGVKSVAEFNELKGKILEQARKMYS